MAVTWLVYRFLGPRRWPTPWCSACGSKTEGPTRSKHITAVSLETFRGSDGASTVRAPRVGPIAGTSRAPE
ncbi:hypothetical protein BHE74_00008863 [Ensete ventricosum]|nr:hypothetical protein GW17_00040732 [Ensete ventricosum]RWW82664.1 hypothetical protein BHE74_00008863 [Ensete ventricosum]